MDGEKDPRNLLLAFDLIKYMIDKLDISRNVEVSLKKIKERK